MSDLLVDFSQRLLDTCVPRHLSRALIKCRHSISRCRHEPIRGERDRRRTDQNPLVRSKSSERGAEELPTIARSHRFGHLCHPEEQRTGVGREVEVVLSRLN